MSLFIQKYLKLIQQFLSLMINILKNILKIDDWNSKFNAVAQRNKFNSINSKLVSHQNFEKYQNFIESIIQKNPRKSKMRWVSNEKRILYVFLICISVIENVNPDQFENPHITSIVRVFCYKNPYSIQYQIIKLIKSIQQCRRRWTQKQQQYLFYIVNKCVNENKWNEIARELFILSKGQYFRQGKHCRQRYYKLKNQKGHPSIYSPLSNQLASLDQKNSKFHDSLKLESLDKVKHEKDLRSFQCIGQPSICLKKQNLSNEQKYDPLIKNDIKKQDLKYNQSNFLKSANIQKKQNNLKAVKIENIYQKQQINQRLSSSHTIFQSQTKILSKKQENRKQTSSNDLQMLNNYLLPSMIVNTQNPNNTVAQKNQEPEVINYASLSTSESFQNHTMFDLWRIKAQMYQFYQHEYAFNWYS